MRSRGWAMLRRNPDVVEVTRVVERRAAVRRPHAAHRIHVLPHPVDRSVVRHAEVPLVPVFRSRTEAEHEATARDLAQARAHQGGEHGLERPRGNACSQAYPLRPGGDRGERHEGLALDLDVPDAVEAGVLGAHADGDDLIEGKTVAAQKQADARRANSARHLKDPSLVAPPAFSSGSWAGPQDMPWPPIRRGNGRARPKSEEADMPALPACPSCTARERSERQWGLAGGACSPRDFNPSSARRRRSSGCRPGRGDRGRAATSRASSARRCRAPRDRRRWPASARGRRPP